jgi:hypothetical protein
VSDSSSSVTLEQVKNLLAERDVHLANWLSSREWKTVGKQPETNKSPSFTSTVTSEVPISQPLATLPISQPQFRMSLNYFSSQTVTPINAMVAHSSYFDPITNIPSSANIR